MKHTRMRMSKEAAALIHDYRDGRFFDTNADAIHGLFSDIQTMREDEKFMASELKIKSNHIEYLEARIKLLIEQREKSKLTRRNNIAEIKRKDGVINEMHKTIFDNGKWMMAAKGKMLILAILAFIGWGGFIAMLV